MTVAKAMAWREENNNDQYKIRIKTIKYNKIHSVPKSILVCVRVAYANRRRKKQMLPCPVIYPGDTVDVFPFNRTLMNTSDPKNMRNEIARFLDVSR
jgi:hypothetical protein